MTVTAVPSLAQCPLPESQPRFGRYRLLYRFAAGGMANLYAATVEGAGRGEKLVAIKVMHQHLAHDREFVAMFANEARLAAQITHPNVVQILELGEVDTSHFIAMEYIWGESVLGILRRTQLAPETSAQIVAEAALGLHAAHELRDAKGVLLKVVHRDISPDNILVSYDGAVKVADFGVAWARDNLHTTRAGTVKGKFAYMAPEQALGRPVDRRADIFSLGVVLYEMTIGRRLFKRRSDAQVLQAVIRCEIPRPSTQVPGYPEDLERVVLTALHRDPDRRFPSALAFHEALGAYLYKRGKPTAPDTLGNTMHTIFARRIAAKQKVLRKLCSEQCSNVPYVELSEGSSAVDLMVVRRPQRGRWLLSALGLALMLALLTPGVLLGIFALTPGDAWLLAPMPSGPRGESSGPGPPADEPATPDRLQREPSTPDRLQREPSTPDRLQREPPTPDRLQRRSTAPDPTSPDGAPATGTAPGPKRRHRRPVRAVSRHRRSKVTITISARPRQAAIAVNGKSVDNPWTVTRPQQRGGLNVEVSAPGHTPQRLSVPLARSGNYEVALSHRPGQQPGVQDERRRRWNKTRRRWTGTPTTGDEILPGPYMR